MNFSFDRLFRGYFDEDPINSFILANFPIDRLVSSVYKTISLLQYLIYYNVLPSLRLTLMDIYTLSYLIVPSFTVLNPTRST